MTRAIRRFKQQLPAVEAERINPTERQILRDGGFR